MGNSLTAVAFFDNQLAVQPHSATAADHIERSVTIEEFAAGEPVALFKVDGENEYVAETRPLPGKEKGFKKHFIQGPSVGASAQ